MPEFCDILPSLLSTPAQSTDTGTFTRTCGWLTNPSTTPLIRAAAGPVRSPKPSPGSQEPESQEQSPSTVFPAPTSNHVLSSSEIGCLFLRGDSSVVICLFREARPWKSYCNSNDSHSCNDYDDNIDYRNTVMVTIAMMMSLATTTMTTAAAATALRKPAIPPFFFQRGPPSSHSLSVRDPRPSLSPTLHPQLPPPVPV